jgi:hypothetical protein
MATFNLLITSTEWTKVVEPSDTDFLITWNQARVIEFASTELNEVPVVKGHRLPREKKITREDVGAGYVWAKLTPDGLTQSMEITLTKTASAMGATGGFDSVEGVHKVAMMVWNPDQLAWQRSTGVGGSTGGGGGGSTPVRVSKRMDIVSSTLMYIGESPIGTLESAAGWVIKRITFDGSGNPVAEMYASGSWLNRALLTYQ